MEEIVWITPKRRSASATKEVSVRPTTTAGRDYTDIWFYKSSSRKITKKERVNVGMTAGRMYFDEAAQGGYKLYTVNGVSHRVRLRGKKEKFFGEYDLVFDAERKLWYIEA